MFDVIQIAYWLSLSTWFGAALFVAIAAPIIFRTVEDADPTLPKVLSVNLDGQHSTLLAGTIVTNLLEILARLELYCAALLGAALIGQWFFVGREGLELAYPIARCALFAAALILALYDGRVVWPKTQKYRQEYIEHADEPDIANAAKDEFDRYHRENVANLRNILFLLLGLILFSGNIHSARIAISL